VRITHPRVRTLVAFLAVLAPGRLRVGLLRRLLGYEIDPTAVIGRSMIDVDAFTAGPGASVAGLNLIRGCERVEIGAGAMLGPLNWVNGIRRSKGTVDVTDREPAFVMRPDSAVTSLHFIDCCDRVDVGSFALVAGLQSQLLTHSFDHRTGKQAVGPIVVGEYSLVGTRVLVMPGVELGSRSIVAGGAVMTAGKYDDLSLFAGVPAKPKRTLDADSKMFTRTDAYFT
jgi:hypothetical protein